jgi:hypothetical protein
MKINFTKGINTNTKPVQTPDGFYRDAENMRASGDAKRTEEGNTHIAGVPANIIQWGNCAIGDKTIIIGTISGKSIIGSLDINDQWVIVVPARAGVDVLGVSGPVQIIGRKNWAGEDIVYFSTPTGSRRINLAKSLPTDDVEFDKVTSLFLEYDLPQATYTGETGSGELMSGVYQFSVRLVTESGASTSFGVSSSIIPVIQSTLTTSRDGVVGNPPQTLTSKSIELSITNVDTAFKYIQIGILTYKGLSNTPVVTISNLIPINDQATLQYTYRGSSDDFGTIDINELITSGIAYSTGDFMTQKDGTLLVGAPTEAAMPDINWFRVAQNITAKFTVKRIAYKEALKFTGRTYTAGNSEDDYSMTESSTASMDQGYKLPITCAVFKGYRRTEVYSFTITPVFVGGVYGPTIHVPADNASNTEAANSTGDPNAGGTLGTFISGELYPDDRYTGLIGTGLRLHKFPDAITQPLIEGNVENGTCFIRVLGVEFSNIVLDVSESQFANQIAGIIIGRVDRRGQETQLAQGIVRPNINIKFNNNSAYSRTTMIGDGYVDWMVDTSEGGTGTQGRTDLNAPDLSDFTFLAPDLIHNKYTPGQATHIKQHSVYTANPYAAPMDFAFSSIPDRAEFSHHNSFFKNILGDNTGQVIVQTETALDGNYRVSGPFGVINAPQSKGGKVITSIPLGAKKLEFSSSSGFVWYQTQGGVNINYHRDFRNYFFADQRSGSGVYWGKNIYTRKGGNFRADFILHTLTRRNAKQYGPLDQMTSMFVHYQPWAGFSGTSSFYNGDTFISKYGLTVADEGIFPYTDNTDGADSPNQVGLLKGANMSGIIYFWLESDNNYDYRHFIQPSSYTEDDVDATGSMPFFPAYKQLLNNKTPFGLLSMHADNWELPGYAKEYNTQYSTQPTAKPYVMTPKEDIDLKGSLVNRIIYSATAVQGEKTDGYQIFLPNNYYDVPQEYGELTDVYVNKELFASTNQVQWRLFFNTLATQATSAGEVVLGTGGAFNRPAVPMATVDGGYGGTAHWTHAVNTVFGRVFVDQLQGKFFNLTDALNIISSTLDDTDRLRIQKLDMFDIILGSEPLRERVFIKVGETMWSYNFERGAFISRHTYKPRWMFSHGSFMYSNQALAGNGSTGIFKHSTGATGIYYGRLHKSSITIVANVENSTSKHFKTLELLTRRTTEAGLNIPFHTFNQMEIWNDERYTGLLTIQPQLNTFQIPGILEVLARRVKDSFRVNVSRDIVINPEQDIFAFNNHAQVKGDTVLAQWLPKMRGTFIQIKLISSNTQGPLFVYDVLVDLAENIR